MGFHDRRRWCALSSTQSINESYKVWTHLSKIVHSDLLKNELCPRVHPTCLLRTLYTTWTNRSRDWRTQLLIRSKSFTHLASSVVHAYRTPKSGLFVCILYSSLTSFKDHSFTCTLFAPFEKFTELADNKDNFIQFFRQDFPDALKLMGEESAAEDYINNPKGSLVTIKVGVQTTTQLL